MEKLLKIYEWIKTLPLWLRAIVLLLVASLVLVSTVSCGQTVRVVVRDTTSGVEIQTSQNRADSSDTHININPNINFTRP